MARIIVYLQYIGIALLVVFLTPTASLPRPDDGEEPAPVREKPLPGTPVTRAPCEVATYEPREGLQYTDTTEQIYSATAYIMGVLKPGNYSYSGYYQPGDPCSYE